MAAGNKSSLIAVPLVWVAYTRARQTLKLVVIPLLLTSVAVLSTLVDVVLHSVALSALFVDRVMVAPGTLTALYYQYFSVHAMTRWQEGFLSFTSDTKVVDPAASIGAHYFGPGNYANASFLA